MHSVAAHLGVFHSHLPAAYACRLASRTASAASWTMPRAKGLGMRRAKKQKVAAAAAVEVEELIEPSPPQPIRFEPERPQEPTPAARKLSRAEEQQVDLLAACTVAKEMWKTAQNDAKSKLRRLRAAQACKVAKYAVWEKQAKRLGRKNKGHLWDKMMIEDERVADIKEDYLLAHADELRAKIHHQETIIACKDATIRDLRARVRKRKN